MNARYLFVLTVMLASCGRTENAKSSAPQDPVTCIDLARIYCIAVHLDPQVESAVFRYGNDPNALHEYTWPSQSSPCSSTNGPALQVGPLGHNSIEVTSGSYSGHTSFEVTEPDEPCAWMDLQIDPTELTVVLTTSP